MIREVVRALPSQERDTMTPEEIEKRKRIMQRSIAVGHCVCDPKKPCPCPLFKEKDICECAGERLPPMTGPIRLTEMVRAAGCASKIGKKDLETVLSRLGETRDPRVLVGRAAGDDAGVLVLREGEEEAVVLTVDVFAPSVDDPYTFGRIAAANSVSDIYAMGAKPEAALSIIGFPMSYLPPEVMREMLRGGIETFEAIGAPVVGGHSIHDAEPKLGFAVIGTVRKAAIVRNEGARPGDRLVLTKPLGTGIVAFAAQIGRATPQAMEEITASMCALNRIAGETLSMVTPHAATDITGFSLLGHLAEIVKKSEVEVVLDFEAIPLFSLVQELSRQEIVPGAVERNREAVPSQLLDLSSLAPAQEDVLWGPETSGGLLIALPADQVETYVATLRARGVPTARVIGEVTQHYPGGRIRVTTRNREGWTRVKPQSVAPSRAPLSDSGPMRSSCCSPEPPSPAHSLTSPSRDAIVPRSEGAVGSPVSPSRSASGHAFAPIPSAAKQAFGAWMASVHAAGALDPKTQKLLALSLSVITRCKRCVEIQTQAARAAGASDAELGEAVALAIAFGGAPVNMFYQELLSGGV